MSNEIERRESPTQEPIVPPHGCRAGSETEPLAVPPAGRDRTALIGFTCLLLGLAGGRIVVMIVRLLLGE